MRREFSAKVRKAIVERATGDDGLIRCEGCGADLTGKRYEIDHIIPEALLADFRKGEPLTEHEGELLGACCHRGVGGKTEQDVKRIAKAKRQRAKHLGTKPKKQKIKSRGFTKIDRDNFRQTPPVPRKRKLYE